MRRQELSRHVLLNLIQVHLLGVTHLLLREKCSNRSTMSGWLF